MMNQKKASRFVTVLLLSLVMLVIACGKKPGKGGILAINDMKTLIWDIMQAEEFSKTYMTKDSILNLKIDRESNLLYQRVFLMHKISQEDFRKSFEFYQQNPQYYKVLADSLANFSSREREQAFIKSRETTKPLVKDSLIKKDSLLKDSLPLVQ